MLLRLGEVKIFGSLAIGKSHIRAARGALLAVFFVS